MINELQSLPKQLRVAAQLENHPLADPASETAAQLHAVFSDFDLKDRRVAVAVGSRGIDRIASVVAAAIETLKSRGARPFIIPAMGSHGGATPEGQRSVLETLGVTETSVSAPIHDSMETVEVGLTPTGYRVPVARAVAEADAVLIINRVKPHTDFVSDQIGSGLRKMCVIGVGKADGSFGFHREASRRGYEPTLIEVSGVILAKLPQVFGLALVEDACHQLARVEAMTGAQIPLREPELLRQARAWMPQLPFSQIDVLIIDEMGKNISGAGMDPNIIGCGVDGSKRSDRSAEVGAIYTRGLTPETHGNAIGLGFADVVSKRIVDEMDHLSTYTNALSSMTPAAVRIPMHFASDAECLRAALRLAGADPATARIVRIKNTLALDRFIATEAYAPEISDRGDLNVLESPGEWRFTAEGNLDSWDS
ncbi:MAG: lactate racemase domain-containing protein [Blastocatellia bacterium]